MGKSGSRNMLPDFDEAHIIALNALAFLASADDRIAGFLRMTGTAPADLRASAADPAFLAGVLHHLAQNQTLLVEFAAAYGIDPVLPGLALAVLDPHSGGDQAV